MRSAGLDEAHAWIKIARRNIYNLRYADDTTLMAESEEELNSLWMKVKAAADAKSNQSCPTLCDHTDSSPPGSSVPGILQARILEWLAISFSNACMHAKSLQSCLTLCDPIDGTKVRGEWKSWLKVRHSGNTDHGIWSHYFMANDEETVETGRIYFGVLQNHCRWCLQPWN